MNPVARYIPQAFAHLVPDRLLTGAPDERFATCNNCAMCDTRAGPGLDSQAAAKAFFSAETKCCTYHPDIPNYAVGGILLDSTAQGEFGRRVIEAAIARRIGVFPSGISRPQKYSLLYKSSPTAFGKAASMRCPLYISGSGACSIWRYRNAVCTTWFCKHADGFEGRHYGRLCATT